MPTTERPDSLLVHPALAGRTVVVRRPEGWLAFDIHAEGRLGESRQIHGNPIAQSWRAGSAR